MILCRLSQQRKLELMFYHIPPASLSFLLFPTINFNLYDRHKKLNHDYKKLEGREEIKHFTLQVYFSIAYVLKIIVLTSCMKIWVGTLWLQKQLQRILKGNCVCHIWKCFEGGLPLKNSSWLYSSSLDILYIHFILTALKTRVYLPVPKPVAVNNKLISW